MTASVLMDDAGRGRQQNSRHAMYELTGVLAIAEPRHLPSDGEADAELRFPPPRIENHLEAREADG